jgi:hypothetical protein
MKTLSLSINGWSVPNAGGVPTGGSLSASGLIRLIIEYLYAVVVILAVVFLLWGGINWITSGGDKQKLTQARQKITFAIVGLIVAFLAFAIIYAIGTFFGVNLIASPV